MADFGSGFQIRVTTEALRDKAETVTGLLKALQDECGELYARVNRTSAYWLGDGAEKRRSEYETMQKTVEKMLQRLSEYPDDLLISAGIYEEKEKTIRDSTQPLASDVIL